MNVPSWLLYYSLIFSVTSKPSKVQGSWLNSCPHKHNLPIVQVEKVELLKLKGLAMEFWATISSGLQALGLYTWQDGAEILILSCIVFYFLRWLKQDLQKPLVLYAYGYCSLTFFAHYLGLSILSNILFLVAPLAVCVFILLHQHTLQKNFVSLKKIKPPQQAADHWIDELMRTSLYAMNSSKHLIWIIERKDSLDTSLKSQCLFYADLKKDLLELLLDSQTNEETILWINAQGKLVAFPATWNTAPDNLWVAPDVEQLPTWQQHALLISSKTDTLVVSSNPQTRLFTVIAQARSVEDLSAHHTALLLKRLIINQTSFQEGIRHAAQPSNHLTQQHHS